MDLIMPGIGGKRRIEEITRWNKDIRVITISGYAENESDFHEPGGMFKASIRKPFDMGTLLMQIRNVLDNNC
jgi:DNA-binding NtrC family response regulator